MKLHHGQAAGAKHEAASMGGRRLEARGEAEHEAASMDSAEHEAKQSTMLDNRRRA
jgi:hypothetical protein